MLKFISIFALIGLFLLTPIASADEIIHDGEFNYLKKQYGEKWAKEDKEIDGKLAEIRKKMVANDPTFYMS